METTQMRFKDLLVSDLGPLPADATINEDLYDLLTLPYSLGTDMNSRFIMYRYHGDDSRYQIQIERNCNDVQDCLRELTDAQEWSNLFVNDANAKATLSGDEFKHEQLGIAYNAIRTWYNPEDPSTGTPVTVEVFGQGQERPTMVRLTRKDAVVDGKLVDDITRITHDDKAGTLSLDYNSRPKSDKVLRELARNGQPFVTHHEEETVVNSKDTNAVVFAARELCEHNFAKLNANELVADLDTTDSLEV